MHDRGTDLLTQPRHEHVVGLLHRDDVALVEQLVQQGTDAGHPRLG